MWPVTFVGHPLMDTNLPAADPVLSAGSNDVTVIGLVPGSRDNEIIRPPSRHAGYRPRY